ncbi:homoserine kinase [Formicincola oecophyllae]|uniref:Homoserine kinase n=1 Tax=Formicincola oecophyllae TaxID=2558361 RepID=A0A4Y6U9H9_9PROT|nr:homoserine kinase [Formicincola oecophyllae]QDH13021.1 homoserine kinase [Formicincola oecophyllae]
MAVYTPVSTSQAGLFLAGYDVGGLASIQPIAEGVENSNFLLNLHPTPIRDAGTGKEAGRLILTLFEKRVRTDELPWFVGLMRHLAQAGMAVPAPVPNKAGQCLGRLQGRPALLTRFLRGRSLGAGAITPQACHELGAAMARLHVAGQSYTPERANALGPGSWQGLLARCHEMAHHQPTGSESQAVAALAHLAGQALPGLLVQWPGAASCPRGQVHADLFPDNVFFTEGAEGSSRLAGMIDFYFACTDLLAWDIAIALNAWCFDEPEGAVSVGGRALFNKDHAQALLAGYQAVRPLVAGEVAALPVLCQGAAMRFLLTRLHDWLATPPGALVTRKSPWVYGERLQAFQRADVVAVLRVLGKRS